MGVICTAELRSQAKHWNRVKQPFPVLFCYFSGSAPFTSARRLRRPNNTIPFLNPTPKKPNPAIRHNRQQFRVLKLLIKVCVI